MHQTQSIFLGPKMYRDHRETGPWRESDRFFLDLAVVFYSFISHWSRAIINSQGPWISPGYYECHPQLLSLENRRKNLIEPKEIPSVWFPAFLLYLPCNLKSLWQPCWSLIENNVLCLYLRLVDLIIAFDWFISMIYHITFSFKFVTHNKNNKQQSSFFNCSFFCCLTVLKFTD